MSLSQFVNDLHKSTHTQLQRYNAFVLFKHYFDGLCSHILKAKTYTDKELADHIFKTTWPERLKDVVFRKKLYAAQKTLARFNSLVSPNNFDNYRFVLNMLAFDLIDIVQYGEHTYRDASINLEMGSRNEQTALEIFSTAEGMFHLGTLNPETAYLREIVPVSIFLLRQAIEVYGKRTLGYSAITDKEGNRVRSVKTQVAWEFIKNEVKKTNTRITLPVEIDIILKVESWTNAYVHTGLIPEIFIIDNAIAFTKGLVFPRNNTMNYLGTTRFDGTTKIKEYNSVKADFEKFIARPKKRSLLHRIWDQILIAVRLRKKKSYTVRWHGVNKVDATILSL